MIAVVGLALILAHIWIRLRVVSVGYALSNTSQLVHTLEEGQQELKVEWEAIIAPGRLTQSAGKRVGLSLPRSEQIIILP
jgi:hypothetical protein